MLLKKVIAMLRFKILNILFPSKKAKTIRKKANRQIRNAIVCEQAQRIISKKVSRVAPVAEYVCKPELF